MPAATRVGGRLPLHATAVGKVLLAFSPPQVWRDLAAAGLAVFTRHTIFQPGRLAAVLAAVVEEGVAYSYEEMSSERCRSPLPSMILPACCKVPWAS
ncbi:hypothetical protein GCM10010121_080970 [Streptomyces brasiliensis]|uniref:IclR-ED domain-containing protein n=1 Tax=Streptomyces brasiliensis TaxID=1954 RepID=A0A917P3R2_9ACTN|nr:IclR family transcriptional regulator C-terminal domain-containing protein [Streptomyces brasiliensis]GGJ58092.1 hypothetical protein GCM10010121_080970 [Streptomyces brasiliensis]